MRIGDDEMLGYYGDEDQISPESYNISFQAGCLSPEQSRYILHKPSTVNSLGKKPFFVW